MGIKSPTRDPMHQLYNITLFYHINGVIYNQRIFIGSFNNPPVINILKNSSV